MSESKGLRFKKVFMTSLSYNGPNCSDFEDWFRKRSKLENFLADLSKFQYLGGYLGINMSQSQAYLKSFSSEEIYDKKTDLGSFLPPPRLKYR